MTYCCNSSKLGNSVLRYSLCIQGIYDLQTLGSESQDEENVDSAGKTISEKKME
jgi:hypothetical protein